MRRADRGDRTFHAPLLRRGAFRRPADPDQTSTFRSASGLSAGAYASHLPGPLTCLKPMNARTSSRLAVRRHRIESVAHRRIDRGNANADPFRGRDPIGQVRFPKQAQRRESPVALQHHGIVAAGPAYDDQRLDVRTAVGGNRLQQRHGRRRTDTRAIARATAAAEQNAGQVSVQGRIPTIANVARTPFSGVRTRVDGRRDALTAGGGRLESFLRGRSRPATRRARNPSKEVQ